MISLKLFIQLEDKIILRVLYLIKDNNI